MSAVQDVPVDLNARSRNFVGFFVLVTLAALTVLSLWTVTPPSPKITATPKDQFSAARAYQHVSRIGQQVHVAGSSAADEVRNYIVSKLTSYGLQPQIQDAVGADAALGHGYSMAHVRNVVAVLPGTDSTGRIFAVAHYDSVQVSYGGNDDGAGVATLLESAGALTQGPKPKNDIVFVFTEAEEACLCGAEAFVSQDPLAAQGGVVLNFEARGSSGPAIMFETSRGNSGVVNVYGDNVPYPVATSFAVEVYRILPNDTDFTPFRESGRFTGLNTAYIDGSAVYHSPEDKPSYMDKGSLQHQGSNALAELRAFGNADIANLDKPSTHDSTYFPVLGFLLAYPGWLVWPLAALGLIAMIALAIVARRSGLATFGRSAVGFGLALIPLLVSAIIAQLFWTVLVAIRPGFREMIDPWRPGWFRAAVTALVAVVVLTWYGLLRRRFGTWPLFIGALGWLAVLGLVLAAVTPGGSYLAALPAVFGAVAAIVALRVPSASGQGPVARLWRSGRGVDPRAHGAAVLPRPGPGDRRGGRVLRGDARSLAAAAARHALPGRALNERAVDRNAAAVCHLLTCAGETVTTAWRHARARRGRPGDRFLDRGTGREPVRRSAPGACSADVRAGRRRRKGALGQHRQPGRIMD